MKGLCPFHDEKTPSFQVTPARGYWYCFGACAEGGDVIDFMRKIDNLSFVEAVERLADRVGIQLRYTDDAGPRVEPGARTRLAEALRVAADFFAEHLSSPDAVTARQFLAERGFDREAAERFQVGFSPRDGRALIQHLRGRVFGLIGGAVSLVRCSIRVFGGMFFVVVVRRFDDDLVATGNERQRCHDG